MMNSSVLSTLTNLLKRHIVLRLRHILRSSPFKDMHLLYIALPSPWFSQRQLVPNSLLKASRVLNKQRSLLFLRWVVMPNRLNQQC